MTAADGGGRLRPQGRHHLGRASAAGCARSGLAFDYVLYSHYERQVEDLVAGRIHVAWNSPLAVGARRAARRGAGPSVRAGGDARHRPRPDLGGRRARRLRRSRRSPTSRAGRSAVGAVDSPQATLIPLDHLRGAGLRPGDDVTVRRFDVGRRPARRPHRRRARRGPRARRGRGRRRLHDRRQPPAVRAGGHAARRGDAGRWRRPPPYDHCNMTVVDTAPAAEAARFGELLLAMSYADPRGAAAARPGGPEACGGRAAPAGTRRSSAAVDEVGFYDAKGG